MPTSIDTLPSSRRPGAMSRVRRTLFFALALLALAAAIWSGLWHFAAGKLDDTVTRIIEREAEAGRKLSCESRDISGFPFAMTMNCKKPRLEMERPSGKVVLAGQLLSGTSGVDALGHVVVTAEGPVSIEAPGISDAEAQWRSLKATLVVGLGGFDHADFAVDMPTFRMRSGQNMIASNAERLEADARPDAQRPATDDAIAIKGKLSHLASPILDALMGEAGMADGVLEASVSHMSAFRPGPQEPRTLPLERWRAAGGMAHISTADLTKGPVKIALSGDVGLDEAHRVKGRLSAAVEGVDTLVQRLQIPKIGINLIKMSGGKLRLPIELADGRITANLGPVAVSLPVVLLPLY
jgi:hypothetical protein